MATQAARFYDFADTNLHEEATTLRLFYPDPTRMCRPGETCTITAPSAKGITGRVAFSGAAWYRPDFRGRELSSLLPPIGRAYAHAIWDTDCTFTFIAKALVDNGAWRRAGYSNLEWNVIRAILRWASTMVHSFGCIPKRCWRTCQPTCNAFRRSMVGSSSDVLSRRVPPSDSSNGRIKRM